MPRCLPIHSLRPFVPTVKFYVNTITFCGVLDSGACFSFLSLKLARVLRLSINYVKTVNLQCANQTDFRILGSALYTLKLGHKFITWDFFITDHASYPCFI